MDPALAWEKLRRYAEHLGIDLRFNASVDLRELVKERMRQRGLSHYWLAERLAPKGVPKRTLYRWLAGKGDTSATVAGLALAELEVELASRHDTWATVRIGDDVVICLVGSRDWDRGSFRVVHGDRLTAEKSRCQRLQALTRPNR